MSRPKAFTAFVLTALITATVASQALAEGAPAGFFIHGGYSSYAMGDVNDNIDDPSPSIPYIGSADHVNGGWNAGAGFRVMAGSSTYLELGATYLRASTDFVVTSPIASTGTLDVSGVGITGSVGFLRWNLGGARGGLAAGGGYYFCDGDVKVRSAFGPGSTNLEGSGPGFHLAAIYDRPLGRVVHLDAALGYRYARSTSVKAPVSDLLNADGSKARIDWSGPFLRLGLALYPRASG